MGRRERLVAFLRDHGILSDSKVTRAFETVDQEEFLPPELRFLAYVNAPIPSHLQFRGAVLPSPMTLAALLHLLELGPDLDVGIVGALGGYPAALVAGAMQSGRVFVSEADARFRDVAQRNVKAAGVEDRVTIDESFADSALDRILVLETGQRPISEITSGLRDMGFAILRSGSPDERAFRKTIRTQGKDLDLSITDPPAGPRNPTGSNAQSWGRLLTRDDLLTHAWEGRVVGHHDEHFAQGMDETFAGGPLDSGVRDLTVAQLAARRAFHCAYILQCLGELEAAEDLYLGSLALFPTSEAHTFLGWTYSFKGDLDRAIKECKAAIDTDPTFGNPYNDIGAYLIEQDRMDDAIPWLKKALESSRYACYFYPHTNLARVYALRGQTHLARKHLEEALKVNPEYEPASEMLRRLNRGTDYVA